MIKKSKVLLAFTIVLALSMALASCSPSAGGGASGPAKVKKGGTFIVAAVGDPISFNPDAKIDDYAYAVNQNLYNKLVTLDYNYAIVPDLAERLPDISPDGKTYTFKVGPTGKIEDTSEFDSVIKQVGEKAFRPNTNRGRTKEPEMINDFVATQWFLWDAISSIDAQSGGLKPGQSWKSKLSLPSPIVMRKARDVVYTLKEIRPTLQGRVATIGSSYSVSDSTPSSWPIPYSGSFQVSGTFGFLGGYKLLSVTGQGEEKFNVDAGQSEQYNQQYEMKISSIIPMGISAKPQITIRQTITAQKM